MEYTKLPEQDGDGNWLVSVPAVPSRYYLGLQLGRNAGRYPGRNPRQCRGLLQEAAMAGVKEEARKILDQLPEGALVFHASS